MGEKMLTLEQVRVQIAALGYNETRARWLEAIDAHLTQPAQAVDVGAIREVVFWLTSNSHWISGAYEQGRKLTAALPNANGKEG